MPFIIIVSIISTLIVNAPAKKPMDLCEMDREEAQSILDYETARDGSYEIQIEEFCEIKQLN